jgi:hypothetical protein
MSHFRNNKYSYTVIDNIKNWLPERDGSAGFVDFIFFMNLLWGTGFEAKTIYFFSAFKIIQIFQWFPAGI